MKEDDSAYKPFSGLSEFVKQRKIPLKKPGQVKESEPARELTTAKKPGNLKESTQAVDETVEFSEVMKDVKKVRFDDKRVVKKQSRTRLVLGETDELKTLLEETLDPMKINVANMPEYMEGHVEGINPLTMDRLRKGEFSVQKTLDLHGLARDDARYLFEEFLQEAVKSKLTCVMVIHGRGLKSKGEPVLKTQLKAWILRAMYRKWVLAFSSSRMVEGGPGATYVLLRTSPLKKRLHIIG